MRSTLRAFWLLVPDPFFKDFTVDRCKISPRLQRRDRDGILMIDISHRLPFSLAPVLFGIKLTPHNTREHLNSVVCTRAQSTRCTLMTDNLNATVVCRVDSLSRDSRIRRSDYAWHGLHQGERGM